MPRTNPGLVDETPLALPLRPSVILFPQFRMKTALARDHEAECFEDAADFSRLEDWRSRYRYAATVMLCVPINSASRFGSPSSSSISITSHRLRGSSSSVSPSENAGEKRAISRS